MIMQPLSLLKCLIAKMTWHEAKSMKNEICLDHFGNQALSVLFNINLFYFMGINYCIRITQLLHKTML